MRMLSIRELREALSHVDRLLRDEGEVVVTRHGHPVARLVPLKAPQIAPSHASLRASMPRMRVPSEDLIRADRERG
jgi:prevent-host-death family protein